MAAWSIMGFFDVPTLERSPWGILCLILNIVPWGGIGTIIAGVKTSETMQIVKGVVQLLLTAILIGWIWSVIDGIRIFTHSGTTTTGRTGRTTT
jgi:hypothetical protein